MKRLPVVRSLLCGLALLAPPASASPNTGAWDATLKAHAREGGFDYSAARTARADLDRFLASLGTSDLAAMSAAERLAFWINAYNAVAVHFVLEHYPDLASVQEVSGFFDRQRFRVAGVERALDEIEDAARELGDPRVHFALVCASSSCPDLRDEAYLPEELDRQLDEQLETFLADPRKGLRYDEASNVVYLSSIFKWYAGDFTGGSTAGAFLFRGGVLEWVVQRLPAGLAERLEASGPAIRYLDYDWDLNDR